MAYLAALSSRTRALRARAGQPLAVTDVDPIILLSVVMLIVWAVGTWFDGPGWIHLLLTVGVFLLVWRIATKRAPSGGR